MIHLEIPTFNFDAGIVASRRELINICEKALKDHAHGYFLAINPEKIVNTAKTGLFSHKHDKLLANFADGVGVVLATKLLKSQTIERIAGVDFFIEILGILNQNQQKLFLFGSSEQVLEQTIRSINTNFPNISIVGTQHGYAYDSDDIVQQINKLSPDVIAVALGSPKQEEWILEEGMKTKSGIYIGVGGTFDVISGRVTRAPGLVRKLGLEWFYRLIRQPSRIKRQIRLLVFMFRVIQEKIHQISKT